MHYMLDLETLGTSSRTAPILQLAMVPFELGGRGPNRDVAPLNLFVNPDQKGRYVNIESLMWWLNTNSGLLVTILDRCMGPASVSLPAALQRMDQHFRAAPDLTDGVWANGPTFDCSMLELAAEQCGLPMPWRYNKPRCVRTIIDLACNKLGGSDAWDVFKDLGLKTPEEEAGEVHDALVDCYRQIRWVQQAWEVLKTQPFSGTIPELV